MSAPDIFAQLASLFLVSTTLTPIASRESISNQRFGRAQIAMDQSTQERLTEQLSRLVWPNWVCLASFFLCPQIEIGLSTKTSWV